LEKQRASAVAARTAIDDAEPGVADSEGQFQQQQLEEQSRLADQGEVDFQESLIIERETEIRNIEQSVGELNELFRDVAHIVQEQGGQLDIISENVQNVTQDTRGANTELRSASRYQKNARNKACCLLVILAVILTIIILAVVLG
jgi:t-SNARE complex subunit (syntaxin)